MPRAKIHREMTDTLTFLSHNNERLIAIEAEQP